MTKAKRGALSLSILVVSLCTFGLLLAGTLGGTWFACRSEKHPTSFDEVFSLWEICITKDDGKFECYPIELWLKFNKVMLGIYIMFFFKTFFLKI